ncbi:MAG: hypothetical protein J6V01_00210, partial [Clostridia bacterium]|nr:hypothetical protein [Clostridia bacterium]
MNSKKKTLPFALLLLMAFASAVSCARTPAEPPETRIINYSSSERDGWEFYSESFSFTEKVNPDYDKSKTVERTGYRVMMKNATTGDEKCPCMFPLCDHTIESDCPMVSRFEILNTIVSGERLLVYSCGKYYPLTQADAMDVTKRGFSSELKIFNLVTGECDTVFSYIANYTSTDYLLGDRYIWFILPDVVDMKTVFMLKRYDMEKGNVTGLYSFETNHAFHFLTDSRIYLANFPASATSPDDLD